MKLSEFKKIYSLSKTLRFELKAVGETANYIEDFKSVDLKKVVKNDKKRADHYNEIKAIIDDYHREYIEKKLASPVDPKTGELFINSNDFEDAFTVYHKFRADPKDKICRKSWEDTQKKLRKKLTKCFSGNGRLFGEKLITEDIPTWLKGKGEWEAKKTHIEFFNGFTTYFSGLNKNRKNMYSSEDHSTAISFRLMNENLPRFFNNCITYKKALEKYPDLAFSVEPEILTNLDVDNISDVFQAKTFINLFTQSGIDSFQELLGGRSEEDGTKHQGLNEHLNLYRQKHAIKLRDLPNLMPLYKQILSDRETRSFIQKDFENDRQLLDSLKEFIELATSKEGLIEKLNSSLQKLKEADPARTYIKTASLSDISHALLNNHAIIRNALIQHVENILEPTPKNGKITKALEKRRENYLKQDVFSLEELNRTLIEHIQTLENDDPVQERLQSVSDPKQPILSYLINSTECVKKTSEDKLSLSDSIKQVEKLFEHDELSKNRKTPDADNKGGKGYQQVHAIQEMLEAFMAISHFVKPLHLVEKRKPIAMPNIDTGFYSEFVEAYEEYSNFIVRLYNKVRNYLTKKPFSEDKIKINFDEPTLLKGWDINKEAANKSVLLRKAGTYYLAIMNPKHNKVFSSYPEPDVQEEGYEKINYKLFRPHTMLPGVFFPKKRRKTLNPSEEIWELYAKGEHKKGDTFNIKSCHKLIEFFKENIHKYKVKPNDEFGWDIFDFRFSPTDSYKNISDFYRELKPQGYKIWLSNVATSYIDECIAEGKIFLFEIYNKDFSTYSKGRPNLHTLYWKGLFEENNFKDVVLKLDGEAEIFYRPHSIKDNDTIVHAANTAIQNKNSDNPKKESLFGYDIVKDRRYTKDKFLFHVPITLNFKQPGVSRFNDRVNRHIKKDNSETHIIGIDRGERHLLYYTVINQQGELIEQGTLNQIETDQGYNVDYHEKLDTKEKERDEARKSWSSIENIKELKAGYLSHVVHKLAKLIIRHNAIVCLEDLNFGFKRGRFKVEKQVYQKFEKSLIEKLNYLVFKDAEIGQTGHYLSAYQLTAPFESFEKLGKQSGILYYVPAAYTSKIDPATGFINFLYTRYESLAKSKQFFENMETIKYNSAEDYFEFEFDYANYPIKQNLKDYQTRWKACTHGDTRYSNDRDGKGIWKTKKVNVTKELKTLFDEEVINYQRDQDLKNDIAAVKNTKFYKKIFRLLKLTLSLRHTSTKTEEDFILSPIKDKNGTFFDSRDSTDRQPKDADANGAYHIALKGLWNLQKINEWDEKNKLKLEMKNEDWFGFIQKRMNQA